MPAPSMDNEQRKHSNMRIFDSLGKKKAVADATALYHGGADGCLVQTVDRVYPATDEADYARVAAMAAITQAVADATGPEFQIGVQMMLNALKASIAVAKV